ncbi:MULTISPECIES: MFS transporter [unclassified Novosphingobium]|uniref:spinster family MFS transporter n=1 Tax=unclassified Novosphingobium TaxID=2644732 RepID=UPI00146CB193|nr:MULTISPECIES: MFS transporter [unclassified Novosphingobium]NMN05061.1 MFS family permease [Novosphingobium sp. SG919]NMN87356.1 MFS family permease [Novosphingobium sp. SG916]
MRDGEAILPPAPPVIGQSAAEAARQWYVLVLLSLVYAMNIADRYVITTVMESIRLDLKLTDSGVALLTGVALALFYVTIGIPVSALADRFSRRNIISGALLLWSGLTVLTGLSSTFGQMLLARIGVGIGESGGTPPSTSMLADYFRPAQRPAALTVYALGSCLGAWIGADVAGRVADLYGWRHAFLALGVPGVALAALIFFTVREPRRGAMDAPRAADAPPAAPRLPLWRALAFLLRQRATMHLMMGGAVTALWGWGLMWWTPTYLQRAYGLSAGQAGEILGPMHLIAGSLATVATAVLMASRVMADPRRVLILMAVVVAVITVPSFFIYWTHDLGVAKACLWLFVPAMYFYIGPSFGLLQNIVPAQMRATACALTLLMANIANLVIAPQFVGLVSDHVAGGHGADAASLRVALLILAPTGLWAAWHYWAATRGILAEQARATAGDTLG